MMWWHSRPKSYERNDKVSVGVNQDCWLLSTIVRCKVSGVSSEKVRASLKPDTRHLKPMLREGFTTTDNVQKKTCFSIMLRDLDLHPVKTRHTEMFGIDS